MGEQRGRAAQSLDFEDEGYQERKALWERAAVEGTLHALRMRAAYDWSM